MCAPRNQIDDVRGEAQLGRNFHRNVQLDASAGCPALRTQRRLSRILVATRIWLEPIPGGALSAGPQATGGSGEPSRPAHKLAVIKFVDHIGADNAQLAHHARQRRDVEARTRISEICGWFAEHERAALRVEEIAQVRCRRARAAATPRRGCAFGMAKMIGSGIASRTRRRREKGNERALRLRRHGRNRTAAVRTAFPIKSPIARQWRAVMRACRCTRRADRRAAQRIRPRIAMDRRALADALPLRAAGGIHALHLSGTADELAPIYADSEDINDAAIVAGAVHRHEAALLPWLDGPPQTNEAGRSSNFIAAMLWLADRGLPPLFDCLEIGSSAGINLMIDRYHYDLAAVQVGPQPGVMAFTPEWRGNHPPQHKIAFAGLKGCDVAPVDLTDPAQALRLKAYVWPEHHIRFARMAAAIAAATENPRNWSTPMPPIRRGRLAQPQAEGTTRVLCIDRLAICSSHQQARITAAMEARAPAQPRRRSHG